MVNNYRLAHEVLDEKRFHKAVPGALKEIRILIGDGLFTAYDGEPNWAIARQCSNSHLLSSALSSHHAPPADRILMPAFNPGNIKGMFDDMFDIATQLVFKWERFGPEYRIDPTDDFTRLALDTIALCSMHYRLNSFYTVRRLHVDVILYVSHAAQSARCPNLQLQWAISWERPKCASTGPPSSTRRCGG